MATIAGVAYITRAETDRNCTGCAASGDPNLCEQLNYGCITGNYIWAEVPANQEHAPAIPTPNQEHSRALQLAMRNYSELADALNLAGGSVRVMQDITLAEFLEILARNRIQLTARYINA